jgi:predicted O-methyltransferase YrrM
MRQVLRYIFTFRRSLTLLMLGPFSASGRKRLGALAYHLGWSKHGGAVQAADIESVVAPRPIELLSLDVNEWNTTNTEMCTLAMIARMVDAQRIFEFGTYDGRTTATMLLNSPRGHAFTIDLPASVQRNSKQPDVGARLADPRFSGRSTQILADTLKHDFSLFFGTVDLIFIDAGHSYECTISDSRNAMKMLKPGGVIIWHDYAGYFPGVTRAVDEMMRHHPDRRFVHLRGTSLVVSLPK